MRGYISRRAVLASTALALPLTQPTAASARYVSSGDGFDYEVMRSDNEWRALLGEASYKIMREGHTETPKSDPLWNSTEPGTYACRGCDLTLYDARWKVVVDKGWLFYRHGAANALLMGVDWPEGSGMADAFATLTGIEVHCRRCGSHMGHIVQVEATLLHCINGASLSFSPAA